MKDIKGYEGLYAVTSCGKVWSYKRKKFLKPRDTGKGYLQVDLCKDGKKKECLIHRLLAEVYIPNPENKPCINHKDENKSNNVLQNLEWVTHKENNNYGTHNEKIRKKVQCIETQKIYNSVTEAAKAVDIVCSGISDCLKGKHNTAGGYHWAYYEEETI